MERAQKMKLLLETSFHCGLPAPGGLREIASGCKVQTGAHASPIVAAAALRWALLCQSAPIGSTCRRQGRHAWATSQTAHAQLSLRGCQRARTTLLSSPNRKVPRIEMSVRGTCRRTHSYSLLEQARTESDYRALASANHFGSGYDPFVVLWEITVPGSPRRAGLTMADISEAFASTQSCPSPSRASCRVLSLTSPRRSQQDRYSCRLNCIVSLPRSSRYRDPHDCPKLPTECRAPVIRSGDMVFPRRYCQRAIQ